MYPLIILVYCFIKDVTSVEANIKTNKPNIRHGYSNYIIRPRFRGDYKKSYDIVMEEAGDKDEADFDYNRRENVDVNSDDYDNTYSLNGNVQPTKVIKRQRQNGYVPYRMRHRYFGGKKRKEEENKRNANTRNGKPRYRDDPIIRGDSNAVLYVDDAVLNKNAMLASKEALYNTENVNKRGEMVEVNTDAEMIAGGNKNGYHGDKRTNEIVNNRDGEMKYVIKPNDNGERNDRRSKVNANKWISGYQIDDDIEMKNSVLRARESGNLRKTTNGLKEKKSINHEYLVGSDDVEGVLNVNDYEDLNRAAKYDLVKDKNSNARKMATDEDYELEGFTNIDDVINSDENTHKW